MSTGQQMMLHQVRSLTLARRRDPVTSHIAAEKITDSGKRQSQSDRVYAALKDHDGATSAEIGVIVGDRHMAARRLPDPSNIHRIRQDRNRMRICKQTGSLSVTWWII